MSETVAICVCTCMRPRMLKACLDSLAQQKVPAGLEVAVVIIDNDPAQSAAHVAAFHESASPFMTLYAHQPCRGISFARNAALDVAVQISADWIAFIDDDEIADPDWLAHLMAPNYRHVPVLCGTNVPIYPTPRPYWAPADEAGKGAEGEAMKTAYTGNVRFSVALLCAGLRFNERLGLMGGEDNEFFAAAHLKGFKIRRTLKAITWERVHPTRLTYSARIYRAYWCAASEMRRLMMTRSFGGAALRKAHTIPLNVVFGGFWLACAAALWPFSREAFKDRAIFGGSKLAKAAGRFAALIGVLPRPYAQIDGE